MWRRDEDIARLKRALDANVAAIGNTAEFIRTDVAFHYELTAITRNPIFSAVHDILVEWLIDQRTTTIHMPDADRLSVRDHTSIYEAVAAHDPMRAFHEMGSHLRLIRQLYHESKRLSEVILRDIARDVAERMDREKQDIWRSSVAGPPSRRARPAPAEAGRAKARKTGMTSRGLLHAGHRPLGGANMKVVVLGAGAVGVATAWYLSKAGHDVTVVERQEEAALETSWGNGGVIHASEVEPWSQPGMPLKISEVARQGERSAPSALRGDPAYVALGLAFARNCTPEKFRRELPGQSRACALFAALASGDRRGNRHLVRPRNQGRAEDLSIEGVARRRAALLRRARRTWSPL